MNIYDILIIDGMVDGDVLYKLLGFNSEEELCMYILSNFKRVSWMPLNSDIENTDNNNYCILTIELVLVLCEYIGTENSARVIEYLNTYTDDSGTTVQRPSLTISKLYNEVLLRGDLTHIQKRDRLAHINRGYNASTFIGDNNIYDIQAVISAVH